MVGRAIPARDTRLGGGGRLNWLRARSSPQSAKTRYWQYDSSHQLRSPFPEPTKAKQIVFRSRKAVRNQALDFSLQSQAAVRITSSSRHSEQMSIQVSIVAGSRFPFNQAKPRRIQLVIPVEWKASPVTVIGRKVQLTLELIQRTRGNTPRSRSTSILLQRPGTTQVQIVRNGAPGL